MRKIIILLSLFSYTLLSGQTETVSTDNKPKFPFQIKLQDVNGKVFMTNELFKKHKEPTVLVFWLSTCYPCRMEIAAYQQKYEQWKKEAKFRMVVISYDFPQNYETYVKRATEEKWPWEHYHDVNKAFGSVLPGDLNGLPQVFVFDKNGEIAYHKRKYYSGDEDALFEKIKEMNK